ncbi:MAG: PEP-CTERM sorting domain-containing protein, partial [Nostocaceae cyanobacterium CSU_2_110]|nr:PEP-CTERM sorting domain-containing protein [Nostocaceae cyanobacterium CSU_2_110]
MNKIITTLATTLTISLALNTTVQARIITSISPPSGTGQGDVFCPQVQTSVDTPFPNNTGNQINNFPGLSCTPTTFLEIAPIDTTLFVEPSKGTTEYLLSQKVVNSTQATWNGFNIAIGFSLDNGLGGDNFASPAVILVPTGFAIPTFNNAQPTSSKFAQVNPDGSFNINWSGGTVAPGESVDFTFSLDIPDDLEANNFYDSFTIRQLPIASNLNENKTVPEPSLIFAFLSLLGF